MSLKIRNIAKDASVTLIDGGPIGSPTINVDIRKLVGNLESPDGSKWKIEVSNAGILTAVKI